MATESSASSEQLISFPSSVFVSGGGGPLSAHGPVNGPGDVPTPLTLAVFCLPLTLRGILGTGGGAGEEVGAVDVAFTIGGVLGVLSGDCAGEGDLGLNTLGEESLLMISTRSSFENVLLLVSDVLVDEACAGLSCATQPLAVVVAAFLVNVSLLLTGVGDGAGLRGNCGVLEDNEVSDTLLALEGWRFLARPPMPHADCTGLPDLVEAADSDCAVACRLTAATCLAAELCVWLANVGLGLGGGGGGGGGGTGGGGRRGLTGGRCLAAELAVAQAMWYSRIWFGVSGLSRPRVKVLREPGVRSSTGLLGVTSLARVGGLLVTRV